MQAIQAGHSIQKDFVPAASERIFSLLKSLFSDSKNLALEEYL